MGVRLYLRALLLPVGVLTLTTIGRAQCSQATRPEPASAAAASAQAATPAAPSADSSSSETPAVRFATGAAVTVLEGTTLAIMNDMPISSRTTKEGAKLSFTVTEDVVVNGILVIPCGATVAGTVVSAKQAGRLVGASHLTLQFTALNLGGRSYPLYSPPLKVTSASKTAPTMKKVATGATAGTLAAEATIPRDPWTFVNGQRVSVPVTAADHAKYDAVLAGVGATVGTAVAAATPSPIAALPAESQIEFTLASPIAVYPVDQRTAMRLARGMRRGGPVLYVRGQSQ
jgi:hypothetical protein